MSQTLLDFIKETGRTQRSFASEIGVREATVSAWVNGGTPRPDQMQKIAEKTGGAVPISVWFENETGTAA